MTLDPRGMIFIDGYDSDNDADVDANEQIIQEKFEDAMEATLISETVKAQSVSSDIEITVYPKCYNYKGMPAMSLRFQVPPEPYPGLFNGETYKDVVLDGLTANVLYKALIEIYARIARPGGLGFMGTTAKELKADLKKLNVALHCIEEAKKISDIEEAKKIFERSVEVISDIEIARFGGAGLRKIMEASISSSDLTPLFTIIRRQQYFIRAELRRRERAELAQAEASP